MNDYLSLDRSDSQRAWLFRFVLGSLMYALLLVLDVSLLVLYWLDGTVLLSPVWLWSIAAETVLFPFLLAFCAYRYIQRMPRDPETGELLRYPEPDQIETRTED